MEMQRLTVSHYGETAAEDRRITISPVNAILVAADMEDIVIGNRSLRHVVVLFTDGGSCDLNINHQDLENLEAAIGSYCLG